MEPKRLSLPSAQSEHTTTQAGVPCSRGVGGTRAGTVGAGTRREGWLCWNWSSKGRLYVMAPICFLNKTLHFDQRHSAHFSRVPQASVQLLTRCPGIFLVFIKFHHALTFPQHTKNAQGSTHGRESWHSVHAYCP